jgi:hypothetical protein
MVSAITTEDLLRLDFSPEQIARLAALRDAYPALEFVSSEEWRRLVFLKWRYEHELLRELEPHEAV